MTVNPMDFVRGCEFWRDGCRTMAAATCEILRVVEQPITKDNIIQFLHSLPRKPAELVTPEWQGNYCGLCLKKAYGVLKEPDKTWLMDYFTKYFPARWWMCQETMIDGFIGLLEGIPWEDFQWQTKG